MANGNEFVKNVETLLRNGNTEEVLKLFVDETNFDEVKNNSWDLIPAISQNITETYKSGSSDNFKCCKKLLNIVVDVSNPEEVLLQLIEEIEESTDDTKFITFLAPLIKVLLRIPRKRLNSLAWSLNALQVYLKKCNPPDYYNLVGKEKLLVDGNENLLKITNLYSEVLLFYDTLIKGINEAEDIQEQLSVITKFLIQLLGKPLAYLDMESFDGIKSRARIIAEQVVLKIFKINKDPVKLLEIRLKIEDDTDLSLKYPTTLGISVLFYLVYSEKMYIERIPKVYDYIYLFQSSLHLVTSLLEEEKQICLEKALHLSYALLDCVKFVKLSYILLDSEDHCKFCKSLCNVIVYNDSKPVRQRALGIYQKYLLSFETRGFYLLINNLMSILNHTGLIGFTITLYKDQLATELKNLHDISVYFRGPKFFTLLRKFCYLHKNEESDLIELCDQIMATLNLLRYLALGDVNNKTNIWEYFSLLEDCYFKHLRKGIDLSRAHYELKVKEVQEDTDSPDTHTSKSKISVKVAGQNLLQISKDEKLNVLNSSLTALDMMDSLLSRLVECIELNNR